MTSGACLTCPELLVRGGWEPTPLRRNQPRVPSKPPASSPQPASRLLPPRLLLAGESPPKMKKLTGAEVRETYPALVRGARSHQRLPSDSLVPSNDPTLLFTGAGMNQFKDMFLGKGSLPHKRVTTSQKCMRVPDLENVGLTAGSPHVLRDARQLLLRRLLQGADCIPWVFGFYTEALGTAA